MRVSTLLLASVCVLAALSLVSGAVPELRTRLNRRHSRAEAPVVHAESNSTAVGAYKLYGFDYAYGNGVTAAQLKAAGASFICRYLSGGNSKDINKIELNNLENAGLKVVFVWETTGQTPSKAKGESDARAAANQAAGLGKGGAPIYFAADFDPNGHQAEINAYMSGVVSVLGHARTGLYAGYAGVKSYFDNGIGKYAWQTYAWSGGAWDARAQIQQYQNGAHVGPAEVDRDRTTADDYGHC